MQMRDGDSSTHSSRYACLRACWNLHQSTSTQDRSNPSTCSRWRSLLIHSPALFALLSKRSHPSALSTVPPCQWYNGKRAHLISKAFSEASCPHCVHSQRYLPPTHFSVCRSSFPLKRTPTSKQGEHGDLPKLFASGAALLSSLHGPIAHVFQTFSPAKAPLCPLGSSHSNGTMQSSKQWAGENSGTPLPCLPSPTLLPHL